MAKEKKAYDFSGWATRFNVKCSDGRTIRKDAFKHNDGQTVPLVWNHAHQSPFDILGHALLEAREEGMYAYCSFNDSEEGKVAKEAVRHGDICSLSIYANQLKQNGGDVIHGAIREVSLVLAGANPGAKIENVMIHGELNSEEAIMWNSSESFEFDVEKDLEKDVKHSDEDVKPATTVEPKNEPATNPATDPTTQAAEDVQHADDDKKSDKEETVEDIINTMNEKQKTVMYALIGAALEDAKEENQEDNKDMKQNAFESNIDNKNVLSHSEIKEIIETAKKTGSLRDAVENACLQHGIDNIEVLFPDAKLATSPSTIKEDDEWVSKVMAKVSHSPFAKVKMIAFDITGEEARARGYVTGDKKEEEVLEAMMRETGPQTVYKLQKLDRDTVIDIVDFDVVAYLKNEMREKLQEELARAILTGDGRPATSRFKINPLHIRPILGDNDVFAVPEILERGAMDDEAFAKYVIKQVKKNRKKYKGSGNPAFYTTEDILTNMLLIEDKNGRVIYDTIEKLKTALRVSDIITAPYFDRQERTAAGYKYKFIGILVNLKDYVIGTNKGGNVSFFDDFDLDFNKYEYLIETRVSGALNLPYSALTFEEKIAIQAEPEQQQPAE